MAITFIVDKIVFLHPLIDPSVSSTAPINFAKTLTTVVNQETKVSDENQPAVVFFILSKVAAKLLFLILNSLINEFAEIND